MDFQITSSYPLCLRYQCLRNQSSTVLYFGSYENRGAIPHSALSDDLSMQAHTKVFGKMKSWIKKLWEEYDKKNLVST